MKLIYVASPYAGDIEKNTEFAKTACRHVMNEGHAFFAPHLLYPAILDDSRPQERQLGINMGLAMLEHCDELWFYGNDVSQGMMAEIKAAEKHGVPTRRVLEQENGFFIGKVINRKHLIPTPKQLPAFHPQNFEVKHREYGSTGGNCMVGTVEVYLPELGISLWVNCNDESASITTTDYMWNSDGSDSWERHEEVRVADFYFTDSPDAWKQWVPMVHEALAYTIEQATAYSKSSFSLPVAWLPDSICMNADSQYLDWLKAEGKDAQITARGQIIIDEAYPSDEHTHSGIGAMGYQ